MEEVVIVGAGPYGLSVAANLRKRRISCRVFGRTMEMWSERMPQGMLLKSDGCATNLGAMPLTLQAFCRQTDRPYRDTGYRIPIEDMIAYGKTFANEYLERQVEDQQVEAITSMANGFRVCLQSGETVPTKRVVVATGLYYLSHLPQVAGIDDRLSHTSSHYDFSRFAGQRIGVIGGGQSALETAALLRENGAEQVIVIGRSKVRWFAPDDLPRTLWGRVRRPYFGLAPGWKAWLWSSPSAFVHLPDKVRLAYAYSTFEAGGTDWIHRRLQDVQFLAGEITEAEVGQDIKLKINGYQPINVDHLIAGTGYVPDMRRISFLAPLMERIRWMMSGRPLLNNSFETSVPGLYAVGYLAAASLGPAMRFVYGTKFAGPRVAEHIARGR